ncbi:sensor histidine kinase [Actinomycetota bacterium Odt1-20B]
MSSTSTPRGHGPDHDSNHDHDPAPPASEPEGARAARRHAATALREGLGALGAALAAPPVRSEPLLARAQQRWVRLLPYVIVLGFTLALLPVTVTVLTQDYKVNGAIAGALASAQSLPLLLALTQPLLAWRIVFAADVLGGFLIMNAPGLDGRSWPWTPMVVVGYLLLMVLLGLRERRRTLFTVWFATGAAGLLFELVSGERSDGINLLLFVLSGVALLVSGTLRERGDAERRLVEQETISEAERSRRTLLEERARIARELHDVVAHHMSVITVQADSAPYRLDGLPHPVRAEFESIAASARESLTEMRRLLAVLRSEEAAGDLAPQPGLDRLPHLVEATVRAGIPVDLSRPELAVLRQLADVSPAVDLSAYRIVQEALSNVIRHAPGARTEITLTLDADRLLILVVNGPPTERPAPLEGDGTGHGLVGMKERVRLVGGTVDVGPLPDGGFRVAARLPLLEKDSGTA